MIARRRLAEAPEGASVYFLRGGLAMGFFKKMFGQEQGMGLNELSRRLGHEPEYLNGLQPAYHEFRIPKRHGGRRVIQAPVDELKTLQRCILSCLLAELDVHSQAMGFEPGISVADHAAEHCACEVVVKMDIRDFFPSTTAQRVHDYFRGLGWQEEAASLLTKLSTHKGALPQGAPTSPRLSNLVNFKMDQQLESLGATFDASYSRYADDLVFSFDRDDRTALRSLKHFVRQILGQFGYRLNGRKTRVLRTHQQQLICGLVVNQKVNLPRKTRRWLRAVEHRTFMGGDASLTVEQLSGWLAYRSMVADSSE